LRNTVFLRIVLACSLALNLGTLLDCFSRGREGLRAWRRQCSVGGVKDEEDSVVVGKSLRRLVRLKFKLWM
jgi:hypothetical protein